MMTPARPSTPMPQAHKLPHGGRPARKARTRAVVAARLAEKRFIEAVTSVRVGPEIEKRNEELVRRTRAAKSAHFLQQYKIAA